MRCAPGGLQPLSSYSSQKQTTTSRIEMKCRRVGLIGNRQSLLGHLTLLCSNTFPNRLWRSSWAERPSADLAGPSPDSS